MYAKALSATINIAAIMWLIVDLSKYSNIKNIQSRIVLLSTMGINTAMCSIVSLDLISNGMICLFIFNILVFAVTIALLHNLKKYGYLNE